MSDDKNLTENLDPVVEVPEVIDAGAINSNDPAEILEVSGIESSIDESEPEAGINSFGAIAGKGLNERISSSAAEELEEADTQLEDSTEISDEEELEEQSIEDLGEINQEIDEDLEENIPEARAKNRRVDVVLNFKPLVVEELNIPGLYKTIRKNALVGDRVYLDKLLFDSGSSRLKQSAIKQLETIVVLLKRYPNIQIEIQGHVCCTPSFHKDAVDIETRKRELSKNRAERVYKFLHSRGIGKVRMAFKGYGNTQPIGKDEQFDRRVELVITKI